MKETLGSLARARLSREHGVHVFTDPSSTGRMMLVSGANVKTVSERLGQASTAFTMDTYVSSVPALEEETAAKVAALLASGEPRR